MKRLLEPRPGRAPVTVRRPHLASAPALTGRPVIWQCVNPGCPMFYREVEPSRWEAARTAAFVHPVPVEDLSRTSIEARGHWLLPLLAGWSR